MLDPGQSSGLVLEASVLINLLATESMEPILVALGGPCHAPEQVVTEIKRHPITGAIFSGNRHPLRQMTSPVSIVSLEGKELDLFLDIVGRPAVDALGDGEAAAIAVAVTRGSHLVIDDRKARRILRQRFSQVLTYWTVDVLRAQQVLAALGRRQAEDCFAKAQRFGRMHVPRT
jgi:predicted nucleic acid-binding protein